MFTGKTDSRQKVLDQAEMTSVPKLLLGLAELAMYLTGISAFYLKHRILMQIVSMASKDKNGLSNNSLTNTIDRNRCPFGYCYGSLAA